MSTKKWLPKPKRAVKRNGVLTKLPDQCPRCTRQLDPSKIHDCGEAVPLPLTEVME